MFFILIISVPSAIQFRSAARQKGYHSPQFWLFPLAVGGTLVAVQFGLGILVGLVIRNQDSPLISFYPYLVGIGSIVLLCAVISKGWSQIKRLPPK